MEFTTEQQSIIDARGCSLIVSAAAGSGKTAVLVERIIGLITDPDDPVDIDTLLVVTFTNAAAAQMKDKIGKAISDRLEHEPDNDNLRRQAALVHNARICTIDSFCQYVLKNSFADIDVDPAFRVAEEGEMRLLEADVLEALIEDGFGRNDEAFETLAAHFTAGSSDDALFSAISGLYRVAISDPWPYEWLKDHMNDYRLSGDEGVPDYITGYIRACVLSVMASAIAMYDRAEELCDIGGLHPEYKATYTSERELFGKIYDQLAREEDAGLDRMACLLDAIDFSTLSRKKNPDEDKNFRDRAKALRDRIKASVGAVRGTYLYASERDAVRYIRECSDVVSSLCRLTMEYMDALREAKEERGILSFSDIEHYALDILVRHGDNGEISYTDAAAEYRSYFSYVFIDEYQDSNLLQELILSSVSGESSGICNRFMVGDVKQSIYRFRQAEPEIFISKYQEYEYDSPTERRVDLNMNFRSRREVLDSCNALFERIMTLETGGADYDEHSSLKYGADYPETGRDDHRTELLFTDLTDPEVADNMSAEGEAIARRIEELIESAYMIRDPENEILRPVRYGDIAVLYRSNVAAAETYKKILEAHSIPASLSGSSGYFDTYEISTLMNLLRIIVNPLQDIPFYGTLESVIGGFTPDEIARIGAAYLASLPEGVHTGEGYLYAACRYVISDTDCLHDEGLRSRLNAFVESFERYRRMSEYMEVSGLLSIILEDTGYRVLMLAMSGGRRRVANVDMLLRKADDYAGTSYFGLYNFIRYIDTLKKAEAGEEEAEPPGEIADCVSIMTVHKSKGLEFPIVIVARLGNNFNNQDSRGRLICDHSSGIGLSNFNPTRRIRYDNLMHRYVADRIRELSLAEEMRIMYVAMTRAREKLILMCAIKPDGSDEESGEITIRRPGGNNRYIDWYLQCICDVKDSDEFTAGFEPRLIPELNIVIRRCDISDDASRENDLVRGVSREILKRELENPVTPADLSSDYHDYLQKLYEYEYPHADLKGLYTKTSVSVLKHAAMPEDAERAFEMFRSEEGAVAAPVPRFISGTGDRPGATARGSAFHRILELYDFESGESLRTQIERFSADGRLSGEQSRILDDASNLKLIEDFLATETAGRMAEAQKNGRLYREAPFMMGIPASEVDDKYPSDETVLIQGIIDVYWIEDGAAVILDYKTDRVKSADRLIELYRTQLDYYGIALEQMHIPVRDKLIYSFALGKTIDL